MNSVELIRKWVEAFNSADVDAVIAFYAEDAVNHQVVTEPLVGRDTIRKLFQAEFARAKMVCNIEHIHDAGEWTILEWSDPLGLRGCGFFRFVDDKITYQRGYFDQLSFFRQQGIPVPEEYLGTGADDSVNN